MARQRGGEIWLDALAQQLLECRVGGKPICATRALRRPQMEEIRQVVTLNPCGHATEALDTMDGLVLRPERPVRHWHPILVLQSGAQTDKRARLVAGGEYILTEARARDRRLDRRHPHVTE